MRLGTHLSADTQGSYRLDSFLLIGTAVLFCQGCSPTEVVAPASPAPEVTVAQAVSRELVQYESFTGRIEAIERVELRARVSGHLEKIHFKPGQEVEQDAVLFELDSKPFQTDLARAEASVAQADARFKRLDAVLKRLEELRSKDAASEQDLENAAGEAAEALAAIDLAKAEVAAAKLNLDYCRLNAPVAGRIGDRLVDEGNLVSGGVSGATLLATVVSVDPIYVAFEMDENTLQSLQQAIREGELATPEENSIPVELALPIHQDEFPIKGTVRFVDNEINSGTGTMQMKAQFPNPKPDTGSRVLVPGMFVRLRIPIGKPRTALMVPESALGSEQGSRFLFVVNSENKAVRLNAEVGLQDGELREILHVQAAGEEDHRSLKADENVIVRGIQRVRSGAEVAPQTN